MFEAGDDLVVARARLRDRVDTVLATLGAGRAPGRAEQTNLEFKEEPGRRGAGGAILEGDAQNAAAVELLAREVPCLANTSGGGALVLGVEDGTWRLIGTDLDAEWLRHRIWERVDVAPAVEVRVVAGVRVLALYVAESVWWCPLRCSRTDHHGRPVDPSEWVHRTVPEHLTVTLTGTDGSDGPAGTIAVRAEKHPTRQVRLIVDLTELAEETGSADRGEVSTMTSPPVGNSLGSSPTS